MCSYLFPVHLVSRVIKNTYFKETFHWLLPNIAYAIWKAIPENLNYLQCLTITPMEKEWCLAPTEKAL